MHKLTALAILVLPFPAAAQTVGVNAMVVNDVRMTSEADRSLHRAAVKERVSLGNDIVTGAASRLQVLLLDRSSFSVGARARVRIDRFVYDPARNSSAAGLSVTRGAFRFMSGKPTRNAPGQSGIRTPIASIGIRGTIVEGAVGEEALKIMAEQRNVTGYAVDPETASLILLRGPGARTAGSEIPGAIEVTSGGRTVTIDQPGMAAFVPAEGQPPIVFRLWNCGLILLTNLFRNPGFPLEQAQDPMPANPVVGRWGEFGQPARQMPIWVPAQGPPINPPLPPVMLPPRI